MNEDIELSQSQDQDLPEEEVQALLEIAARDGALVQERGEGRPSIRKDVN